MDISHWMAANRLQMNPAKTELLWAGTKYNVSLLGCHAPTLQLGSDIVMPSNHVRVVLGITISADLSLDQHVSKVCAAGFYRLRQLRCIRKSLDKESTATLVHAFVTSRVDYCNTVYAMSPQTVTNRLQRLNAVQIVFFISNQILRHYLKFHMKSNIFLSFSTVTISK